MSVKCGTLTVTLLLIAACHRPRHYTAPSIEGLRYDARAAVVAETLVVTARAINISRKVVVVIFDSCNQLNSLRVQLKQGSSLWDSRRWESQRTKAADDTLSRQLGPICAGGVVEAGLGPGQAMPYVLRTPMDQILGDSLGAGRYRVTARVRINGRDAKVVGAGEVELTSPNTR